MKVKENIAFNHMISPIYALRQGGRQSIVKSIQYGSIAIGSGAASNTATITSVTTANSLIFWNGATNTAATTNNNLIADVALTNSTTVTATRTGTGANTCTARFVVVEFVPGVLTSVQRGTITIASGSTSNTATITSVSEDVAFFNCLGFRSANSSTERADAVLATVDLTAATTVTATRAVNDSNDIIVGYQVAEFNSLYIHQTAKVSAVLSAASGFMTVTKAIGTAISTYPIGGVPLLAYCGFKTGGSTLADCFYTPSHEFSTNNTYKNFFTRDPAGSSTSGTTVVSMVFFKADYIKASQLITVPLLGASSATDLLPSNMTAAKTAVIFTGVRSADGSSGLTASPSVRGTVPAIYYDGANLIANRGNSTSNLFAQTNILEFV